jgi:VWFA-related protein
MASKLRLLSFLALTIPALSLVSFPLAAQPAAEISDDFIESIDVRVVNVEAVVTDRQGKRVRDLSPKDFRLLVDGKEVALDYFTEVVNGEAAPAVPGKAQGAVPQPVEGVVGRSVLVFVDKAFSLGTQLDVVVDRIEQELANLGPEDRVAVVSSDGTELKVLTGWTGDRAAIRGALAQAKAGRTGGADVRAERERLDNDSALVEAARGFRTTLDDFSDSGQAGPSADVIGTDLLARTVGPGSPQGPATGAFGSLLITDLGNRPWKAATKIERTINGAMAALRGFSGAPGRKTVLLLSGGWPVTLQPGLFPQLIDTANRLGYTLYPVDVAGIETSPVAVSAGVMGPSQPGLPGPALISSGWERDVHYGLEQLARWTGGTAALNSNRLVALDRLVGDTSSYYWIGFSPTWRGDGRRHAVRLEARRRGLQVRSRRSFTDLSPAAESAMSIEGRLMLGRDVQEKALRVELGVPRQAGLREIEVPLTLGIPVEAISFLAVGDFYQAELPLHVTSFDSTDTAVALPPAVLRVVVKQVPPAGEMMRFESKLRIRRGEKRLRFTVADAVHDKLLWGEETVGAGAKQNDADGCCKAMAK